MKKIMVVYILLLSLFFLSESIAVVIEDYNDMKGWTFYSPTDCDPYCGPSATSTDPNYYPTMYGWRKDSGNRDIGDWRPRSAQMYAWDGSATNNAEIDTINYAPSSSSGGSLHIYDTLESESYQSSWWTWFGLADVFSDISGQTGNNRLSFYIKINADALPNMGADNGIPTNVHVGTYLCWGDSCPDGEGPGNQHYYHYLSLAGDGWYHVKLDPHPNIVRGPYYIGGSDYVYDTFGVVYWDRIIRLYTQIHDFQAAPTDMWIDEYDVYTEPVAENDLSVCSLAVGYHPNIDKWEITWHDLSYYTSTAYQNLDDTTQSTFEVRWSNSPITNENYSSATLITPDYYGGISYSGTANLIRRTSSWATNVWTRFSLPDQTGNSKVYFAVKDISVSGGHAGSIYPWNRTDGHNAPSELIKTIDYSISDESPIYKPPTISIQSASTSTVSATITGEYTIADALTAVCTWSHSGDTVTGFATLLLGVVSGTVTNLPVGTTSVHFSLLDSESQEATDTALFTRSEATTDVSKGVTIQGVQWNQ